MTIQIIKDSVAASEDSATAFITTPSRTEGYKMFSVSITNAATVLLQGRMHVDDVFHTIKTYTESGADSIVLFPQMRTSMTNNTGTVNAWLDV